MTPRKHADAQGWTVGTRLIGTDPKAEHPRPSIVTITAIGRDRVLVTWSSTHHETDLPMHWKWALVD